MQCNCLIVAVVVSVLGLFVCSTIGDREGELNDECILVTECRHFAYICGRNRTCQCLQPYYKPNKYWNKCVGLIGQKCQYDDHCIEGAFCKEQKICHCKERLHPNEDNSECSHSTRVSTTKYTVLPVLVLLYLKIYI